VTGQEGHANRAGKGLRGTKGRERGRTEVRLRSQKKRKARSEKCEIKKRNASRGY